MVGVTYALVLVILLPKQDLVPPRTVTDWVILDAPALAALGNSLLLGVTGNKVIWLRGFVLATALYILTIGYAISL